MSFSDIITSKHPAKTSLAIWTAGWMRMLIFMTLPIYIQLQARLTITWAQLDFLLI